MNRFSSPIGKLSLFLLAFAVVMASASLAQAQHRGYRGGESGPNQEEMMNRIAERLDLTDDQREQLTQIHKQHREETEALRENVEAAHDRLNDLIDAEQFDESAIRAAAAEFSAAQVELFVSRAQVQQQIRGILTPEQYEQMTEMRSKHHGMMKKRHSAGFHGGRRGHGKNQPVPEDG